MACVRHLAVMPPAMADTQAGQARRDHTQGRRHHANDAGLGIGCGRHEAKRRQEKKHFAAVHHRHSGFFPFAQRRDVGKGSVSRDQESPPKP
jgi:hypothetical protein